MDKHNLPVTRYVYMCKDDRHNSLARASESTTHSEVLQVFQAVIDTQ